MTLRSAPEHAAARLMLLLFGHGLDTTLFEVHVEANDDVCF